MTLTLQRIFKLGWLARLLASPDVMARYDKFVINDQPKTPEQAAAFFKIETTKWNRVIQAANLQLD